MVLDRPRSGQRGLAARHPEGWIPAGRPRLVAARRRAGLHRRFQGRAGADPRRRPRARPATPAHPPRPAPGPGRPRARGRDRAERRAGLSSALPQLLGGEALAGAELLAAAALNDRDAAGPGHFAAPGGQVDDAGDLLVDAQHRRAGRQHLA